jgi:hypothetical protein
MITNQLFDLVKGQGMWPYSYGQRFLVLV